MFRKFIYFVTACLLNLFLSASPHSLSVGPLLNNPIGYDQIDLQFSWKLPKGSQSAWEIRSASRPGLLPDRADLWSSGRRESSQSVFVDYEGKRLGSGDELYWVVRYWNADGVASDWSTVASVEYGLLQITDWEGQWIGDPDDSVEKIGYAPYFRKAFEAKKDLVKARLHFTAQGAVDFSINGQAVSEHYFAPGWPDYRKRRIARTVDVTELIEQGSNAIGAVLSDGWYSGNLLFSGSDRYGGLPRVLCQLELSYADGSQEMVVSDETWRVSDGAIRFADFYDGERYDARKEQDDWNQPKFDDSNWKAVDVEPVDPSLPISFYAGPAVEVVEERAPLSFKKEKSGSVVFDFGVNLVGVPQLSLPMVEGQTVTLRFAEALNPDGTPHYKNLRLAKATDRYTAGETGEVRWSPRFTFHGYRYMELRGMDAGVEPRLDWVKSLVLSSAVTSSGEFSSSVEDWNQLQKNIRRSQMGNFLEVPTDCPQRNERLGWTGDIQVFGPTAAFNFQSLAFLEKWCRDMRDGQHLSGKIPEVAPDLMIERVRAIGTPGWGDAIVIVPWDMYQKYGYKRILRDNFEAMIDWVAYYDMETASNDGLWIDYGYADWLQPFQKKKESKFIGDTGRSLLGTAYYARSASLLAEIAEVLGEDALAKQFSKRADAVRERFLEAFFEQGVLKPREDGAPTQTSYLLALAFDLLPEEDRGAAVAELERVIVEEAGGNLRTGFVGTPLINRVLSRFDLNDLAYEVALKEDYPSWIYSIRQGATSIWERWNSYSLEDGFNSEPMNSLNHYAYGAIGQWMYESVAGLSELAPGYRRISIAPEPGGPLTAASAKLDTPYGVALSSWAVNDGQFALEVRVPPNTTAFIDLPSGETSEVGPGSHTFECGL